ncbi:MAG: hypothetical protein IJ705_09555 [Oscillospiraceae bacterium]|nr:hypothetical protein [Oscillospiraceae bacterium]
MNLQKDQLADERKTDAEIVADIVRGVPVDTQDFFKVCWSVAMMGFKLGIKSESGRQMAVLAQQQKQSQAERPGA